MVSNRLNNGSASGRFSNRGVGANAGAMERPANIVILTGAGVSAESGLATFRGPDGLWEGHRVEDVWRIRAFCDFGG